jgi:hypothetical protein
MPDTLNPIANASPAPWPAIDCGLLDDGRPALPDFPLASLPPFWRSWASETAAALGAPVDYVVQTLLASVAGVCGAGVVARLTDSWDEPLILWLALVGGPAHGKTPALDAARRALAAVDKPREQRFALVEHDMPLPHLLSAAAKRPAGALLWRDEPGSWLATLGCNGRREPVDLGTLLAAFSPLRTAQGVTGPALSLIGCLDPARLAAALHGSDDGRAARLLYAWPRPAPWRPVRDRPALRESEAVGALQRIARAAGDPDRPQVLKLHDQALAHLDGHLEGLQAALRRSDGIEAAWLAKAASTIARLAAALALLGWAANPSPTMAAPEAVTGDTLLGACRLWDYYRAHAGAVLARGVIADGASLQRRVLGWIRAHTLGQVSREDVRRHALGQALNAEQSLAVIGQLERAGFLRKVICEPTGAGRPPLRWDVNPALIGESLAEIAGIAEIPGSSRASSP